MNSSPRLVLADLEEGRARWLLTVNFAGRDWRFASERTEVVSGAWPGPEVLVFEGGLDDISQQLALDVFGTDPGERSVTIDMLWPEDVAALEAQGHRLTAATGELALWVDGTSYEQRRVIVAGPVSSPEYGAPGEPVTLTISEETSEDTALWPPPSYQVTEQTWPDASEDADGAWYPWPFGTPGVYVDAEGTERHVAGSPAPCVEYDDGADRAETLLVAAFRVVATHVRITYPVGNGGSWAVSGALAITYVVDGLGQECAVVDVSGESFELREAGEWWAVWSEGGAMLSPYRPGVALDRAVELVRWWAEKSSLAVDTGRLASLEPRYRWAVAGYFDEPVVPWEWLEDNLLPLLPVSVDTTGNGGKALVPWRYDARREEATDHLEAGPGISRDGRITRDRAAKDIRNDIRIRFAMHGSTRKYKGRLSLRPQADLSNDGTSRSGDIAQSSSSIVQASALGFGVKGSRVEIVETDIVYDYSTAGSIARWKAFALALSHREVTYEADIERVGWWDVADVVTLTDDDVSIDDAVCLVLGIELRGDDRIGVTLQVLDDIETRQLTAGPGVSAEAPSWS